MSSPGEFSSHGTRNVYRFGAGRGVHARYIAHSRHRGFYDDDASQRRSERHGSCGLLGHSLGCAIVSRKLARAVGFEDPEKAYLGGLLHDLGSIINMVLFPQQEKAALDSALQTRESLGTVESKQLGFSHARVVKYLDASGIFLTI